VILSVSHGDRGNIGCLDRGRYLGIQRAGAGRRVRRGDEVREEGM
jgi:hypothetical protein